MAGGGGSLPGQNPVRAGRGGGASPPRAGGRDRPARQDRPAAARAAGVSRAGCGVPGDIAHAPGRGGAGESGAGFQPAVPRRRLPPSYASESPVRGRGRGARAAALGGVSAPSVHPHEWAAPVLRPGRMLEGADGAAGGRGCEGSRRTALRGCGGWGGGGRGERSTLNVQRSTLKERRKGGTFHQSLITIHHARRPPAVHGYDHGGGGHPAD